MIVSICWSSHWWTRIMVTTRRSVFLSYSVYFNKRVYKSYFFFVATARFFAAGFAFRSHLGFFARVLRYTVAS